MHCVSKLLRCSSLVAIRLPSKVIAIPKFRFRLFSSLYTEAESEPHLDDDFSFPVFVTLDGDSSFHWSGASISHEVCSLHSDEFVADKKTILVKSNNIIILLTEHNQLGAITFTAIKSRFAKKFKFCSVSVFGDIAAYDASCLHKVQLCIKDMFFALNQAIASGEGKSVDLGSYFTSSFLAGNIPPDSGHLKCLGHKHTVVVNDGDGIESVIDSTRLLQVYKLGGVSYTEAAVKQIVPLLISSDTVMVKVEVHLTGKSLSAKVILLAVLLVRAEIDAGLDGGSEYKWLIGNILYLD